MDWDRAEAFMADVLPVARMITGPTVVSDWLALGGAGPPFDGDVLERLPPEQHPTRPELTVAAAELVEGVGHPDSDAGGAAGVDLLRWSRQVPTYEFSPAPGGGIAGVAGISALPGGPRVQGKARVRLTYRQQPYTTQVANAQLPSPYKPEFELSRYVVRSFTPSVQSTQVGGSVFYLVPNDAADAAIAASLPLGSESPAKILPFGEYRLRWVMVPSPGVPRSVFSPVPAGVPFPAPAVLGRLNFLPFDLQNLAPEGGTPFAAGRLLLLGVESSEPYRRMGAAYWYRDFTFIFAVAPGTTWNYFFRRGVGFRQAVRHLPGVPIPTEPVPEPYLVGATIVSDRTVFNYGDFNSLFRLAATPDRVSLPGGGFPGVGIL